MYILALSSNKDVLGLQTAMIHALFVTVLDRVENLTKGVLDLLRRTWALNLSLKEFVGE